MHRNPSPRRLASPASLALAATLALAAGPAWSQGQIDGIQLSATRVLVGESVSVGVSWSIAGSFQNGGGSDLVEPAPVEGWQQWMMNWYWTETTTAVGIDLQLAGQSYSDRFSGSEGSGVGGADRSMRSSSGASSRIDGASVVAIFGETMGRTFRPEGCPTASPWPPRRNGTGSDGSLAVPFVFGSAPGGRGRLLRGARAARCSRCAGRGRPAGPAINGTTRTTGAHHAGAAVIRTPLPAGSTRAAAHRARRRGGERGAEGSTRGGVARASARAAVRGRPRRHPTPPARGSRMRRPSPTACGGQGPRRSRRPPERGAPPLAATRRGF